MSDKEVQAVSGEDWEMFKALVSDFYQRPWEESYVFLRADIWKRFLRRGTNSTYNSLLVGEADDLVTRVVIRYSRVYGKMRRAGKVLDSFEAMLENRVKLVYFEALRRYLKVLTDVRLDDPDSPEPAAPALRVDTALEDEEERKRLNGCLIKCLGELSEHARHVLIEYCNTDGCPPQERSQMRLRLALREARLSADSATPEQVANARTKLNTAVSRWRNNRLRRCKEKCLGLEATPGRDV